MVASCIGDGTNYKTSTPIYANFEYTFNYDEEFGADSLCFNTEESIGFGYSALAFYHKLNESKTDVDGGFILSYLATPSVIEVTDTLPNNNYRAYDSKYKTKNTYVVYKSNPVSSLMPEHDVQFTQKALGTCTMQGCYVTNTIETAKAVASSFGPGDMLVLKAVGYCDGVKTGEASMKLAEFSSSKDSIVCTWTPFDLSALGSIEYVDFEVTSDKPGIPLAFCMDYVVAQVDIEY